MKEETHHHSSLSLYDPDCMACKEIGVTDDSEPLYFIEQDPLDIDYQKAKDDKKGFND